MIDILHNKTLAIARSSAFWAVCTSLVFTLLSTSAFSETRQHGSHVHGEGKLNIAFAGKEVHLELESPAANIAGFEHAPTNYKQKKAVHDAENRLKNGNSLFIMTENARCRQTDVRIEHDMLKKEHEHHNSEKHNGHKEERHGHGNHSEFHVHYKFECSDADKLKNLDVMLFTLFPGFEKVNVQLLTPTGQTAVELTPKKNRVNL